MTTLYGDGDENGMFDGKAQGQTLTGNPGEYNYLYGEAETLENSRGGKDVLTGGNKAYNYLYGDAKDMQSSWGGNDVLTGGESSQQRALWRGRNYEKQFGR